jgi:hypothetical protein
MAKQMKAMINAATLVQRVPQMAPNRIPPMRFRGVEGIKKIVEIQYKIM